MKQTRLMALWTMLAVMLTLLLAAVPQAQAQGVTTIKGKALFDVNIRLAPGTNRAVIGLLPYGEEVEAIGRNEGNNWIQINYQDITGWVAAWLLIFEDDTSKLPVTTDVEPPPASGKGPFDLVTPFNLNLRAAPDLNSAILEVIPYNTPVQAIARSANSSWIEIKAGTRHGWVAAWLVVMRGDINMLPVSRVVGVQPPTARPTIPASAVTILTPYQVNLRAAPNLGAGTVAVVPFNQLLTAIGRNAGNNWIQVSYEGRSGWVAAWIVPIVGDPLNLPVTSPSTDYAVTYQLPITAKALVDLTIRSGPNAITAVLGTLPANTEVELLARSEDSAWVKIRYNNSEGWITAWPLIASGDLNNLLVEFPNL